MPRRAKRARLAHEPQRDRGGDDVADHRNQSDQPVDAVAHVSARHDEGDVEQFCQRIKPRQPLLARQIAENIARRCSEFEMEALPALVQRLGPVLAAFLVDDRRRPAGMLLYAHAADMGIARALATLERAAVLSRDAPAFTWHALPRPTLTHPFAAVPPQAF